MGSGKGEKVEFVLGVEVVGLGEYGFRVSSCGGIRYGMMVGTVVVVGRFNLGWG